MEKNGVSLDRISCRLNYVILLNEIFLNIQKDELDALVEKFEQDGKNLDEFEASTTPVPPSKPTSTQTTTTAPPPSKVQFSPS